MKRVLLSALAATVLSLNARAAPVVAPAPDLQALLTHESINTRSDGVTETFRYQERLLRAGDTVWLERVLPPPLKDVTAQPGTAGDHGPNLQTLPRWIRHATNGSASLTLIERETKVRIPVKPLEFGRLGFSGNWAAESRLIDPATLKTMTRSPRAAPELEAQWYEATRKGRYSRILWSERLQFPLAIETGSENGRSTSRTTVAFETLPKSMPWIGVEAFLEREIDDYGD